MKNVDTSNETLLSLALACREAGNKAHEQVGCTEYMRILWTVEKTLAALVEERTLTYKREQFERLKKELGE